MIITFDYVNDMSEQQIRDVLIKHSTVPRVDRGRTDKADYHAYEFFYPSELQYLSRKAEDTVNILEVGTAMGGSLRCWMELYPTARFFGISDRNELDDDVKTHPQMHMEVALQSDPRVGHMFPGVMFDLIIDDASHQVADQIATFNMLKNRVVPGGKYVIEDIYPDHRYPTDFMRNFRVVDLIHIKNRADDKLFVYDA
jgi:hypothetical protein